MRHLRSSSVKINLSFCETHPGILVSRPEASRTGWRGDRRRRETKESNSWRCAASCRDPRPGRPVYCPAHPPRWTLPQRGSSSRNGGSSSTNLISSGASRRWLDPLYSSHSRLACIPESTSVTRSWRVSSRHVPDANEGTISTRQDFYRTFRRILEPRRGHRSELLDRELSFSMGNFLGQQRSVRVCLDNRTTEGITEGDTIEESFEIL